MATKTVEANDSAQLLPGHHHREVGAILGKDLPIQNPGHVIVEVEAGGRRRGRGVRIGEAHERARFLPSGRSIGHHEGG